MEALQTIRSHHHARQHMSRQLERRLTGPHQATTTIHTHPSTNLLPTRRPMIRGVLEQLMTHPHLRQHQHPQLRMERLTAYQHQRQQHRMGGRLRRRTAGSRRRQDGAPGRMFRGMKRGRQAHESRATGMRQDEDSEGQLYSSRSLDALIATLRSGPQTGGVSQAMSEC